MQLGIFAKTFAGTEPSRVLSAAKAAGYATVQYNMACSGLPSLPHTVSPDIARAVADAAMRSDITIAGVSATYNMIHPDPGVRAAGHAILGAIAGRAHAMGTRFLTLCTGTRDPYDQWRRHPDNSTPEAWRDMLASMEVALDLAEAYDVELGVEPEQANVVDSANAARRLLDTMKSPRLKVVIDPANLVETEPIDQKRNRIADAIDLLAGDIVMAHAKDRSADGSFATVGKGAIDFPHYIACLAGSGFDGPIVAHGLDASEAAAVARFLTSALQQAGA